MSLFTFNMPDIGEGVVEGEVISWLKKEGDILKKDEPVLILMTDKATVELPTPHPGILTKTYYKPGDIAKKGLPLFDVELKGTLEKPQAAPPVRKLARELGVSLQEVKGSGPEGRILKQDLPHASNETPVTGIRRLMAKKMAESHAHIPPFSYFEHADATRLVGLREKMQKEAESRGLKLTYMPFFLKALSATLLQHPLANTSYDEAKETLIQHAAHNIGIAMKTPLGLIVPVLHGVEKMSLTELVENYAKLTEKAKNNQLSSADMKGATITLTNFGALSHGADYATPIINHPEVAILGLAYIHKEPVVIHDALAIAEVLHCSWSFDHRVIDGEAAAAISSSFLKLIENPAALL
jgi:pyruvate dehydrogenase E2 component (dihydrolipoamide acetyltransferase)